MSRPPLNRITISATTPTRSTVMMPTSSRSEGNTSEAIAAPARNSAGAGIGSRPVSDVATTASTRPAVTSVSGPAKSVISGNIGSGADQTSRRASGDPSEFVARPAGSGACGRGLARRRHLGGLGEEELLHLGLDHVAVGLVRVGLVRLPGDVPEGE